MTRAAMEHALPATPRTASRAAEIIDLHHDANALRSGASAAIAAGDGLAYRTFRAAQAAALARIAALAQADLADRLAEACAALPPDQPAA